MGVRKSHAAAVGHSNASTRNIVYVAIALGSFDACVSGFRGPNFNVFPPDQRR
ncbi:hypothetical protein CERZMDRAFT_90696 [Cercospora zeae-maydis SCOH1-5]|uniref:Uncharacterized protein n=1 Tax=Cercospora zeae-maydis SCOH1-5 TaxID=717836 RepID=A0A6A6FHH9_9PEZI|nr:hypothetical protein CERZMDRAFT_90696 [Cercospora zeae-maydis SCOH1-5]